MTETAKIFKCLPQGAFFKYFGFIAFLCVCVCVCVVCVCACVCVCVSLFLCQSLEHLHFLLLHCSNAQCNANNGDVCFVLQATDARENE